MGRSETSSSPLLGPVARSRCSPGAGETGPSLRPSGADRLGNHGLHSGPGSPGTPASPEFLPGSPVSSCCCGRRQRGPGVSQGVSALRVWHR